MDQDTAQTLFRDGGWFVFIDVPEGTEFSIDCNTWNTGPNFKGVKMIPPGIHFIGYSALGVDGQQGPKAGFFHDFKAQELVARIWSKKEEGMSEELPDEMQLQRLQDNKLEMDTFLGAYPYESYRKWVSLTNHVSWGLVARLQPTSGRVSSAAQFVSEASTSQSRRFTKQAATTVLPGDDAEMPAGDAELPMDSVDAELPQSLAEAEAAMPELQAVPGTEMRFSNLQQRYPPGASPQQVTRMALDTSWRLEQLVLSHGAAPSMLLGEMQLAFVCFLCAQLYVGLEQWKQLLALICAAEEALTSQPEVYHQLIQVLHFQLKEVPEDFFVDIVAHNNFLLSALRSLFANVKDNVKVEVALARKAENFKASLQAKYGWDFDDEGDDAPLIVAY